MKKKKRATLSSSLEINLIPGYDMKVMKLYIPFDPMLEMKKVKLGNYILDEATGLILKWTGRK